MKGLKQMKVDEVIQEVQETIAILESQLSDWNAIEMGITKQIESEKIKLEALQLAKQREEAEQKLKELFDT